MNFQPLLKVSWSQFKIGNWHMKWWSKRRHINVLYLLQSSFIISPIECYKMDLLGPNSMDWTGHRDLKLVFWLHGMVMLFKPSSLRSLQVQVLNEKVMGPMLGLQNWVKSAHSLNGLTWKYSWGLRGHIGPPHIWWWPAVNGRTPFTSTSMCGRVCLTDRGDFCA